MSAESEKKANVGSSIGECTWSKGESSAGGGLFSSDLKLQRRKRHETNTPNKLQLVNEHKQSIIWLQSGCGLQVGVLGDHPSILGI